MSGAVPSGRIAYRCTECDVNWPRLECYRECPGCGEPTWPSGHAKHAPISEQSARSLAWHLRDLYVNAELDRAEMERTVMAWIEALPVAPTDGPPMLEAA